MSRVAAAAAAEDGHRGSRGPFDGREMVSLRQVRLLYVGVIGRYRQCNNRYSTHLNLLILSAVRTTYDRERVLAAHHPASRQNISGTS